jgi:thiamine-monophosphate kinase
MLAGGDDYELCFTAPVRHRARVEDISRRLGLPLARIGAIVEESSCTVRAQDGSTVELKESGYDHFR